MRQLPDDYPPGTRVRPSWWTRTRKAAEYLASYDNWGQKEALIRTAQGRLVYVQFHCLELNDPGGP